MRHRIYGKHLGRNKDERDILFKGLVYSLLSHGTIQTSEAKAKAIKGLVDRIINLAKDKKSEYRLQSFVTDKNLRERLVKEIIPRLGTRTSGFTSLVKLGTRLGDQTMMVRMSLIGAEELKPMEKESRVKSLESSKKEVEKKSVKAKPKVNSTKKTKTARVNKKRGLKS